MIDPPRKSQRVNLARTLRILIMISTKWGTASTETHMPRDVNAGLDHESCSFL